MGDLEPGGWSMIERNDHNLTREVVDLTGLTASALARKLRVKAADISAWIRGRSLPPPECVEVLRELIERAGVSEPLPGPRVQRPRLESRIVCADSREYFSRIPDESVDCILSDIPYGIGLDDWDVLHDNSNSAYLGASEAQRKAGQVFKRRRKPIRGWSAADRDIPAQYYEWCGSWAGEWLRVLRPGGSAMVFAGRRLGHRCTAALEDAGFSYRDMLAWLRPRAVFRAQRLSVVYRKRGALAEAKKWQGWRVGNLRPAFEPISWFFKPYADTIAENVLDHGLGAMNAERFSSLSGSSDNILRFGFEEGEGGLHEAQKPVALLEALIELCTIPGQLVLDPFMGSGSTAVAAARCGRRYVAIEQDRELCDLARERLEGVSQEGPGEPGSVRD